MVTVVVVVARACDAAAVDGVRIIDKNTDVTRTSRSRVLHSNIVFYF